MKGDRHVRKPYNSVIRVALGVWEAQCGVQASPMYPDRADSRGQERYHKGSGPGVPQSLSESGDCEREQDILT